MALWPKADFGILFTKNLMHSNGNLCHSMHTHKQTKCRNSACTKRTQYLSEQQMERSHMQPGYSVNSAQSWLLKEMVCCRSLLIGSISLPMDEWIKKQPGDLNLRRRSLPQQGAIFTSVCTFLDFSPHWPTAPLITAPTFTLTSTSNHPDLDSLSPWWLVD